MSQSTKLALSASGALFAAALLLAPGFSQAQPPSKPIAKPQGYAEGIYAGYSVATGNKLLFEVETLEQGRLDALRGLTFGEVITAPEHRFESADSGLEITSLGLVQKAAADYGTHDLEFTTEDLAKAGYPTSQGVYRKLQVASAIDDHLLDHQALELCWPKQGHCVLVDPAVIFIDSIVNNHRRLAAEGFGLKVFESHDAQKAGCGLASNPSITNRNHYWGSYTVQYTNVFGGVLVEKNLGSQQSGMRCNSSCQPAPYGYSNSSSCWGTGGWTCACDNKFGYGSTGSSGKWISETRCTHRWVQSAKASGSVHNQGSLSVDITWTLGGGVDANGGQISDTCGYF